MTIIFRGWGNKEQINSPQISRLICNAYFGPTHFPKERKTATFSSLVISPQQSKICLESYHLHESV